MRTKQRTVYVYDLTLTEEELLTVSEGLDQAQKTTEDIKKREAIRAIRNQLMIVREVGKR